MAKEKIGFSTFITSIKDIVRFLFRSESGSIFQFKVMQLCLHEAAATSQSLMDYVLAVCEVMWSSLASPGMIISSIWSSEVYMKQAVH